MQVWCYLCQTCKAQMWLQLQMLQMLQHLTLELYCCHWYWYCTAFTDTATLLLSLSLKLYWCHWHWNCTAVTDTEFVLLSLTELYGCHWHWNSTDVTDTGTDRMGKVPQTCPNIPGGGEKLGFFSSLFSSWGLPLVGVTSGSQDDIPSWAQTSSLWELQGCSFNWKRPKFSKA